MKKHKCFKTVSWCVLLFIFIACIQLLLDIKVSVTALTSLLTVFSIFFGFYVTSFSVFATSKYLGKLYQIDDKDDNSLSLLNVLLNKFANSTYSLLSSIIYILICLFVKCNCPAEIFGWVSIFVIGTILLNLYFAFVSINYFKQVTLNSAIENSENLQTKK